MKLLPIVNIKTDNFSFVLEIDEFNTIGLPSLKSVTTITYEFAFADGKHEQKSHWFSLQAFEQFHSELSSIINGLDGFAILKDMSGVQFLTIHSLNSVNSIEAALGNPLSKFTLNLKEEIERDFINQLDRQIADLIREAKSE